MWTTNLDRRGAEEMDTSGQSAKLESYMFWFERKKEEGGREFTQRRVQRVELVSVIVGT